MAYEELLRWALDRPLWQRDALRRVAMNGELTDDHLTAYQQQILQAEGLPAENVPDLVPLAAAHLGHAASNTPKTLLASLGPVQNVDRLASDQPPLRFIENGITVIYGANASGKSGYCRIAKQLCRSLDKVAVRGNVYNGKESNRPKISVSFRVGDDEQPTEKRVWYADQAPPDELSRISVFDTATARIYADKQRKIEFLPYELDLMNKLGRACRYLENIFNDHLKIVNAVALGSRLEGYHYNTTVEAALDLLVPQTSLSDLPSEQELRRLGKWTAEMGDDLAAITEQLQKDPQILIRKRREAKQALQIAKKEIVAIDDELGAAAVADLRQKSQLADDRRLAAEAAATTLFASQPISNLGSETWRQMLQYAREFAAIAFPDASSPQLVKGGLCVLCQQSLDETSAARMTAFDDYIASRAAEDSAAAAQAHAQHCDKITALTVKEQGEVEILLAGYVALSDDRKEAAVAVATYVKIAGERLKAVQDIVREERYKDLDDLNPFPDAPIRLIENEIARLDTEIHKIELSGRDDTAIGKLRARHDELLDTKKLSEDIEAIVERRNRLEEHHKLDACKNQCRTDVITRRITKRRREVLTPTLKEKLHKELEQMQLTHIPLVLSDRGQKSESIVEVALITPQPIGKKSDILSEGEQRALALACFLAELDEIGGGHAIIVDDPVSSLDQYRMEAVARRLAKEAAGGRQVIVFTHSILFHHMLKTEARRAHIALHCEWMSSRGDGRFGLIDANGEPWQMQGVDKRLRLLEQEFTALANDGYSPKDRRFRPAVTDLYTKMRETWERIVEEILFNNAVQRFRPEIMTQRVEEAFVDPENDYPAIYEGMKRCSRYSGHDPARDLSPDLPELGDISCDIRKLRDFANSAIERRKGLRKAPRYEEGVEPKFL